MKNSPQVDAYISRFPDDVQKKLQEMRTIIQQAAPETEEAMAYGIPTYKLNGNVVHFGGFKSHVGFYPAPRGIEEFQEELAKYQGGKGTIKFSLEEPLPAKLITKIVKFRVAEQIKNRRS